jgi:hypothetical protein
MCTLGVFVGLHFVLLASSTCLFARLFVCGCFLCILNACPVQGFVCACLFVSLFVCLFALQWLLVSSTLKAVFSVCAVRPTQVSARRLHLMSLGTYCKNLGTHTSPSLWCWKSGRRFKGSLVIGLEQAFGLSRRVAGAWSFVETRSLRLLVECGGQADQESE